MARGSRRNNAAFARRTWTGARDTRPSTARSSMGQNYASSSNATAPSCFGTSPTPSTRGSTRCRTSARLCCGTTPSGAATSTRRGTVATEGSRRRDLPHRTFHGCPKTLGACSRSPTRAIAPRRSKGSSRDSRGRRTRDRSATTTSGAGSARGTAGASQTSKKCSAYSPTWPTSR